MRAGIMARMRMASDHAVLGLADQHVDDGGQPDVVHTLDHVIGAGGDVEVDVALRLQRVLRRLAGEGDDGDVVPAFCGVGSRLEGTWGTVTRG